MRRGSFIARARLSLHRPSSLARPLGSGIHLSPPGSRAREWPAREEVEGSCWDAEAASQAAASWLVRCVFEVCSSAASRVPSFLE